MASARTAVGLVSSALDSMTLGLDSAAASSNLATPRPDLPLERRGWPPHVPPEKRDGLCGRHRGRSGAGRKGRPSRERSGLHPRASPLEKRGRHLRAAAGRGGTGIRVPPQEEARPANARTAEERGKPPRAEEDRRESKSFFVSRCGV
jgi:hypothetical protein